MQPTPQHAMLPSLPAGIRGTFVETELGKIHYVSGGSGSPLFLIHGGHGGWVHWYANLPAFAQHHTVVGLDMPGFGQSADTIVDSGLAGIVRSVWEAIVAIRASLPSDARDLPFHLGAFSFGTLVATELALQQPHAVRSLLLINPPGLGEVSPEVKAIQARAANVARMHGLRAGLEVSLHELMLCQPTRADPHALALLEYGVRNTRFVSRSLSRATRLLPLLGALRMPTYVVLGENDPHQHHELESRRALLEQALGVSNVSVLAGAAHWLQYDQPDRFNVLALSVFEDAPHVLPIVGERQNETQNKCET